MLFKNLVFHRLPAEWSLTAAELEGQLAGRPLVLARQPAEHLRGEVQQPGPDLGDLLRGHAGITPRNPAAIPDLTKYY